MHDPTMCFVKEQLQVSNTHTYHNTFLFFLSLTLSFSHRTSFLCNTHILLNLSVLLIPKPYLSPIGLQFCSAGILLTHETDENTFYLTQEDLREILNERGGKYVDNVSKNTTVFILGDMQREEGRKKGKDSTEVLAWEGSKKYKDLQQQLSFKTNRIRQMSFEEFMDWYSLDETCFLNSRIAQFDAARHPPGIGRTRTRLWGATLQDSETSELCRPRHFKWLYLPSFRAKKAEKLEASKHLGYKRAVIPESERIASALSSSSSSSGQVQDNNNNNNNDEEEEKEKEEEDDDSTDTDEDD